MDKTLHLHEFFVEGNSPEESHVLLNITEPSTSAEKNKGYFFVICEINNGDTKYIAKMQNIIDEIENSYYEIPDQEYQTALEIVLNKINQENIPMIQPEISLHCIVGAIRENDIIFSFYGYPQMILFYKTKDGLYKKMDLVAENQTDDQGENGQLFSQIVQGKIGSNDFFFVGTPNITNYFNHDRLQKIITTRPPRQSSEHLQRVLSELKNNLSFGGIIINLQEGTNAISTTKISTPKKGDSARSLKNLFSTEKNTASILSPSFLPKLQDKINDSFQDQEEPEMMGRNPNGLRANTEITSSHLRARHEKIKTASRFGSQDLIKKILITIWKVIKYVARFLIALILFMGAIFATLGRNLMLLFFVITNYQDRRRNILLEWRVWWRNLKDNLKRLPLITKILLTVSVLLILIFSIGIIYVKDKQQKAARAQAYINTTQAIKTKEDEAESSLVYGDTPAALAKLKEAESIIQNLPCTTVAEKTNCQNLQQQLTNLQMKARKVTLVTPQLLADWTKSAENFQISDMFLLSNKIYGFSKDNANILIYDMLMRESKLVTPDLSIKNFITASVPKENDYAVLLYDNQNIAQFQPNNNSWKKVDISYPNQNANIVSLVVYNRKLYSLDTANNKIYRHDAIKTGFSMGKEWTQNNTTDLKSGVDLSIDGDVFVLNKNGTISKFSKGQIQNFIISNMEPPLTSADKIWTYNDLNYIYILDTLNKRIVILDKTGQFKAQITANEFVKPTGMIIDEQQNSAYILDSNKLYQISLQ